MNQAIILFAHGARDPAWAEPLQQLRGLLQAQQPEMRVELAFLELMSPSLAECIGQLEEQGFAQVLIVPAFMARGSHLKRDLPLLLAQLQGQHPELRLRVSEALGEALAVQQAMAQWIAEQALLQ